MSEDLKEEILQLISDLVDDDVPIIVTVTHLTDIVTTCTNHVDDLAERAGLR